MGPSGLPNIVGACRQDAVVVGCVVEERAWSGYVGQKKFVVWGAKTGAEIAHKTCYSCATWRRRKSTDKIFASGVGVPMTYTNAKFHVVTRCIGRDRARKVLEMKKGGGIYTQTKR